MRLNSWQVKDMRKQLELFDLKEVVLKKEKYKISMDSLSIGDINIIHNAIKTVAGMCDGARELDGCGFNKLDSDFGSSLAGQEHLSKRQAIAGIRMVIKYKRQLPPDVILSLQAILEGKRISGSGCHFDVVPEFYAGRCVRINVIDNNEAICVQSFCPSQWGESVLEKLLEIGLKKLDIKAIRGILNLNAGD